MEDLETLKNDDTQKDLKGADSKTDGTKKDFSLEDLLTTDEQKEYFKKLQTDLVKKGIDTGFAQAKKQSENEKKENEERARIEKLSQDEQLKEREKQLNKREALADANLELASKGLPTELAEVVMNLDKEIMKENIDFINSQIDKVANQRVNDKLKGSPKLEGLYNGNNSNLKDKDDWVTKPKKEPWR